MTVFATDLRGSGRIYADRAGRAGRAEKTFGHGFTRINADKAKGGLSGFDSWSPALSGQPADLIQNAFCLIRVYPRKSVAKKRFCPIRVDPRPIRANPWQKTCEVSR